MKSLSEKQLNDRIRRAVSAMTPDLAETLWETPVEEVGVDAWFLDGTKKKKSASGHAYIKWASLAAACFAIMIFSWFQLYSVTDATVFLDVNPSVSFDVNRVGRVVEVTANNEDGRIILDSMNLKNTDVDVATNALLGSMVRHGYLSQTQNILLISVNGKNEIRTEALKQRVSADAEQTLNVLLGQSIILEQTLDLDDEVEKLAEQYGITPGKATLILRLLQDQATWDIEELAGMPMPDLIRYCQAADIDISQYLGDHGEIIGDLDSLHVTKPAADPPKITPEAPKAAAKENPAPPVSDSTEIPEAAPDTDDLDDSDEDWDDSSDDRNDDDGSDWDDDDGGDWDDDDGGDDDGDD